MNINYFSDQYINLLFDLSILANTEDFNVHCVQFKTLAIQNDAILGLNIKERHFIHAVGLFYGNG